MHLPLDIEQLWRLGARVTGVAAFPMQITLDLQDLLHPLTDASKEALAIIGATLLLVIALGIWAVYFRKRGRRRKHHHSRSHNSESPRPETSAETDAVAAPGRRRRRRRHHRPRNPTLAETGGLPPVRSEPPPAP